MTRFILYWTTKDDPEKHAGIVYGETRAEALAEFRAMYPVRNVFSARPLTPEEAALADEGISLRV